MRSIMDAVIIACAYLALSARASDATFAWIFIGISIFAWMEAFARSFAYFNPDKRLQNAVDEVNAAIAKIIRRAEKRGQKVEFKIEQ